MSAKAKYKKCKLAPKRFKSAFLFYSAKRHREIREQLGDKEKIRAADVAKLVSKSWKLLDAKEKEQWEEMARVDKERYEREKALYKGPWKVPDVKYPDAPKKPMSAFLAFGNERRKSIAEANPLMSNAEISSLLSKLWKECPPKLKQRYRDKEKQEREDFKRHRDQWVLMKQREAGVEIPMEKVSGPIDHLGDSISASLDSSAYGVAASNRLAKSEESGEWEDGMCSSDLDSEHDNLPNLATKSEKSSYSATMPQQTTRSFNTRSNSGTFLLPQLLVSQQQSLENYDILAPQQFQPIENYSMEALLDDEELFEDFAPQDAPTTAPFVENPDIDSGLAGGASG